jgi:DMSO/TMAO reductase YedYZ molybdopterin-dependent catalytic subunit
LVGVRGIFFHPDAQTVIMSSKGIRRRLRASISPSESLFAILAGLTGVAGSYAVAGPSRQFLVAPIDATVVALTPGQVIAVVIQTIGEQGHLLHLGLSIAIASGLLAGTSIIGLLAARRAGWPPVSVLVATVLAWGVTTVLTNAPALAIGAAGPVAIFTAVGSTPHAPDDQSSRRRALVSSAAAVTFLGISLGLGRLVTSDDAATPGSEREMDEENDQEMDAAVSPLMADARAKALDIEGDIPGLVSTFEEFYNTDIAQFDPDLDAEGWSMTITGEVGEDVTISFDELTDMPTERRFVTLRCVGEGLNGQKLDTAVWTGTPIEPLLKEADPEGDCGCAMLHAEDDYFVQFPVEALDDGFLAWGMNGQPLPQSHGHPVRVLIPGHWGETNVKWLDEIELLDEEVDGYWERRGWHGTGPVKTVAKLWSETTLDTGNIEVAGHAYAGTRGIERVEVSIDGGDTWQDAELSAPLPGDDVWRQWRYEFDPDGSHTVVVRAIDGEGTVQPEEESDSYPSGATGWVSKRVN